MKSIFIPGEKISDTPERVAGTYIESGKTLVSTISFLNNKHIIPLEGPWVPRIDDTVVGIIIENRNHVYTVDLSFFGRGLLIESKFERQSFDPDTVIEAKVKNVEDRKTVILSYPKPLSGGVVINVKPSKISRIIGRENTMVDQIAEITNTRIAVGFNGFIWIKGIHVKEAMDAISMIEENAHTDGLTERIKLMLEKSVSEKAGKADKQKDREKKNEQKV